MANIQNLCLSQEDYGPPVAGSWGNVLLRYFKCLPCTSTSASGTEISDMFLWRCSGGGSPTAGSTGTHLETSPGWLPDTGDLSLLQGKEIDGVTGSGLEAIAAEWYGYIFMTRRWRAPTSKEAYAQAASFFCISKIRHFLSWAFQPTCLSFSEAWSFE